jgi:hypothetical protein
MDEMAQNQNYQGVIAIVPPFEYCEIEDILEECYDDWLSCDGNLREALEFSIDDTIDLIRDNEVKKERNKDAR